MPVGTMRRWGVLAGVGVAAAAVLLLVGAQLLLPAIAAKRASDRVRRYGTVKSASVSAWPAVELLWGKADSATVKAGTLALTPAQAASLLWESRNVSDMTVTADAVSLRVAALAHELTVGGVRMEKHGSATTAIATLTQRQLDEALPSGLRVQPVASGGGQVEVRASGGLFGLQASISALVRSLEGRLVAEPRGFPLAGVAAVTLFSDPHLKVESVGVAVQRRLPLTYRLSLRASLR